jgi:hypothetical protein
MNNNIFATTCDQYNVGTAFLVWSIHHITGQKKYYSLEKEKTEVIPDNPLLHGTAHKTDLNVYWSTSNLENTIDRLNTSKSLNHVRFFPHTHSLSQYNIENKKFQNSIGEHGVKVINITCEKTQSLIGFLRANYEDLTWQNDIDKVKKHCLHYWPHFLDNADIFLNKLNTLHDIRENIAFNLRPYEFWKLYGNKTNSNKNTYVSQIEDFLFNGEKEIKKILKFLNYEYEEAEINTWQEIHKQWSDDVKHYINFCNDIELIVKNIINNTEMDLKKYKMNVLKEAVILHLLMYKHDLNFKKQTDKMPNNTQDIFILLTKNDRVGIEKLYENQS